MPEGDTIHRAARTLSRALCGKTVTRFETAYAHLAAVDVDRPVAGRTVTDVSARGKHLLMGFSDDLVLVTHMRMSGSWHIYRPGERWQRSRSQARIVIETADVVAVAFEVPVAAFHDARSLARDRQLAGLGPDVLAPDFSPDAALANLRARPDREIAEALLDQRALSGIGNVYKSELLFLARTHPFESVRDVSDEVLRRLLELGQKLLRSNVIDGADGPVTYIGLRRTTRRADPSERLWVYGRAGQPCRRCATPVELQRQGDNARSTYFCPRCQPRAVLCATAGDTITSL